MDRPSYLRPAQLTENARTVLAKRYLKKDSTGAPTEEPEDMFWRVAKTIAEVDYGYGATECQVEALALQFYNAMAQGYFMPNSPTLMNAGRPLGQLSACFVLPVEDSISNGRNGIYETLRDMAVIHQSGGGTGFSFSRLRAEGSIVRSTTGVASGPVSFMRLYDASTDVVKQGGTRRGANMGILRVDHPDILKFIQCKRDTTQITNFNISVAVTDEFMECVREGEPFFLTDGQPVDAREVFHMLVEHAHATGEPGLFFIDEANRHNPVPHIGEYEATNPCGEQPLLPYDVCNLGSINLGKFVTDRSSVDWVGLRYMQRLAVHFLDNVIDANNYPIPAITDLAQRIRRIGLGPMGWADMLVKLGVPYNSDQAIEFAKEFAARWHANNHIASALMAEKRGVFPEWDQSIWGPEGHDRPLRNCNVDTVAPTGTISIIAGCSSGIEPLFALAFKRWQAGVEMVEVNEDFRNELEFFFEPETIDGIINAVAEQGHLSEDIAELLPEYVTAHEVSPRYHVLMQAAWQKHCDSAISKTINFANEATVAQVKEAYLMAWELKCKGITVYRDGSRGFQPLSTGKTEVKKEQEGFTPTEDDKCPSCGNSLVFEEGCMHCIDPACGYSACSMPSGGE